MNMGESVRENSKAELMVLDMSLGVETNRWRWRRSSYTGLRVQAGGGYGQDG